MTSWFEQSRKKGPVGSDAIKALNAIADPGPEAAAASTLCRSFAVELSMIEAKTPGPRTMCCCASSRFVAPERRLMGFAMVTIILCPSARSEPLWGSLGL